MDNEEDYMPNWFDKFFSRFITGALFMALDSLFVLIAWNSLAPVLFGGPSITYWAAVTATFGARALSGRLI